MIAIIITMMTILMAVTTSFVDAFIAPVNTIIRHHRGNSICFAQNPLATSGDWSAYLDQDNTGLIYYFNGKTGESLWEKPFPSFPDVQLTGELKATAKSKQEEYIRTQQRKRKQQQQQEAASQKKGFFSKILEERQQVKVVSTTLDSEEKEQLKDMKQQKAEWFGGIFDEVVKSQQEQVVSKPERRKNEEKGLFGLFDKPQQQTATSSTTSTTTSSDSGPQQSSATGSAPSRRRKKEEKGLFGGLFDSTAEEEEVIVPANIEFASYVLPHPEKVKWGGEDAVFVKGRTFGVFDGVSGATKTEGVPLYSKTLASEMEKSILVNSSEGDNGSSSSLKLPEIGRLLTRAAEVADKIATGASTAVVGSIGVDGFLRVLNLGDSACVVIRQRRVTARTREISHYFDCPYQLSVDSPDRPRDGTKFNVELMKGDLVLMGSDGIFDNLTDDQIATIATSDTDLNKIARRIAEYSRKVSLDKTAPTPYAKLAKRYGDPDYQDGVGGKVDDICCVVASYN
jgi:protein phosphatase PTC7